jgi:hypothetical protein
VPLLDASPSDAVQFLLGNAIGNPAGVAAPRRPFIRQILYCLEKLLALTIVLPIFPFWLVWKNLHEPQIVDVRRLRCNAIRVWQDLRIKSTDVDVSRTRPDWTPACLKCAPGRTFQLLVGFIHILMILAIIAVLARIIQGRSPV